MEGESFTFPRQPLDMLDFLMERITAGVQAGIDPETIVEQVHDYSCYWLTATDLSKLDAPLDPQIDKRLN